jgi:seryl-tRNA(Sec) selenium transferase
LKVGKGGIALLLAFAKKYKKKPDQEAKRREHKPMTNLASPIRAFSTPRFPNKYSF